MSSPNQQAKRDRIRVQRSPLEGEPLNDPENTTGCTHITQPEDSRITQPEDGGTTSFDTQTSSGDGSEETYAPWRLANRKNSMGCFYQEDAKIKESQRKEERNLTERGERDAANLGNGGSSFNDGMTPVAEEEAGLCTESCPPVVSIPNFVYNYEGKDDKEMMSQLGPYIEENRLRSHFACGQLLLFCTILFRPCQEVQCHHKIPRGVKWCPWPVKGVLEKDWEDRYFEKSL